MVPRNFQVVGILCYFVGSAGLMTQRGRVGARSSNRSQQAFTELSLFLSPFPSLLMMPPCAKPLSPSHSLSLSHSLCQTTLSLSLSLSLSLYIYIYPSPSSSLITAIITPIHFCSSFNIWACLKHNEQPLIGGSLAMFWLNLDL